MVNFRTLSVIVIFISFCDISSSEIQSENENIFEERETGVIPCNFENIDANFHRIYTVTFYKADRIRKIFS